MRIFLLALTVSTLAVAGTLSGSAEHNPARHHPSSQGLSAAHRVIVKLRASTFATSDSVHAQAISPQNRVTTLAARVGLTMRDSHPITDRIHVMLVEPADAGDSVAATATRLKADPDVEYAEPDQRRYTHAVPNDTLYAPIDASHPGQCYMQSPV